MTRGARARAVVSGGQRRYSDSAIVTALTLRVVFHLALRQTEGFVASLIRLMGLDLETPDYTTPPRRYRKSLGLPKPMCLVNARASCSSQSSLSNGCDCQSP